MAGRFRVIRQALAGLALVAAAACTTLTDYHGYVPEDSDLARIEVGRSDREAVAREVGHPSSSGVLAESGWFYVRSRFDTYGYRAPVEVDREVVAISFDAGGTVTNVERFGIEEGNVVALSRRVTERNVEGVSFLRQLFGNVGNFDLARILADE